MRVMRRRREEHVTPGFTVVHVTVAWATCQEILAAGRFARNTGPEDDILLVAQNPFRLSLRWKSVTIVLRVAPTPKGWVFVSEVIQSVAACRQVATRNRHGLKPVAAGDRKSCAFTLLELLVSIGIISL